jgi:hypothetical protein
MPNRNKQQAPQVLPNGIHGIDPSRIPKQSGDSIQNRSFLDVTALIRSLQRAEGKNDCFRNGVTDCDHVECPWRGYCMDSGIRTGFETI